MAEATLNDVIATMRIEEQLTRSSNTTSLNIVISNISSLKMIMSKFVETMKESMARQARADLLASKDVNPATITSGGRAGASGASDKPPEKKGGFLTGLGGAIAAMFGAKTLGGLFAGIGKKIMSGLRGFFNKVFKPEKILKLLVRLAARVSPVAIVAGIIAAISGGISSFMESEETTMLGRITEGIFGAVGQVIEFFSFGLIKKEDFMKLMKPIVTFFNDMAEWVLLMIKNPGKALDKAIAAMTKIGIWFSNALGDLWESLGLDDLSKVLFGTKISSQMVSKFFTNLFSSKPDEGYFSITKVLSDLFTDAKKYLDSGSVNVSKYFTNLFSSTPEAGYFSITKVLSDLFADVTTVVKNTTANVSKYFTNLFSSTPEAGYFSITKVLSDLFTTGKESLASGSANVSKYFTNLFSATPDEGYFSIAKVLSDLFTAGKKSLASGKESVSKYFTNLFSAEPEEGYFSIAKVLSDLFTAGKKSLASGKESVSKYFTNLFSSTPEEGYFSIAKVLSDLFTDATTALANGGESVTKIFTNLFSAEPEKGYFSITKMLVDGFNTGLTILNTIGAKISIFATENIIDPIRNAFTSAGKFMSSLPDTIMFSVQEIWINTIAKLKIGFIKFSDLITNLPKLLAIMAEGVLTLTDSGKAKLKARKEALKLGGADSRNAISAIEEERVAQVAKLGSARAANANGGNALIDGSTTSGDHVGTKVGSQTINHHYHHYNSDGPSPGFMAGGFGRI